MATLYITEFSVLQSKFLYSTAQMALQPALVDQVVAIGGSSTNSAAFNANTNFVRLHTDAICSIQIGLAPTATTTNARLAANETEYYGVRPGDKVAVISNS